MMRALHLHLSSKPSAWLWHPSCLSLLQAAYLWSELFVSFTFPSLLPGYKIHPFSFPPPASQLIIDVPVPCPISSSIYTLKTYMFTPLRRRLRIAEGALAWWLSVASGVGLISLIIDLWPPSRVTARRGTRKDDWQFLQGKQHSSYHCPISL